MEQLSDEGDLGEGEDEGVREPGKTRSSLRPMSMRSTSGDATRTQAWSCGGEAV